MTSAIVDPVRPAGDTPLTSTVPESTRKRDERRAIAERRKRRRQERRAMPLPLDEDDAPAEDSPASPGGDDEAPPTVDCLA